MNKNKKLIRSVFVIVALCGALVGVIYAMRYTQGYEFRRGLEIFFGSAGPRSWNWCPADAKSFEWNNQESIQETLSLEEVCNVVIEPVPEEQSQQKLLPLLTVSSASTKKTLEADHALEVFSVDGMVFKSSALTRALRK